MPLLAHVTAQGLLGRALLSPPRADYDDATDTMRGLYRAARYFCSCGKRTCTTKFNNEVGCPDGGQRVGVKAEVVRDQHGQLCVEFTARDKKETRAHIAAKYPDPMAMPYQPGRRRAD